MSQANLLCHKMKIPETLDHLMFCLTKDILCKQPDNVYEFAADFFHQLVEARNGTDPNSFPGSHAATLSVKGNLVSTSPARRSDNVLINEENKETDDFEKELLELNEDKTEREGDMSPPPTLDESMSDHDSSPVTIAAIVTSKTLESPRSVIFTSLSRPTSGSSEIPKNSENSEEGTDSFDVNRQVTSASNILESELDLPSVPIDEVTDEMNLAAIQIQSAYRGHRARREIMATNHNTEIDTSSADLVENNEEEFENEHMKGEVEKIDLEESNEEDKTKEIDVNVKTDGEDEACTYNTDVIDSESVEKISVDNEICNALVLEEVVRTDDEIDCTEEHLEAQTEEFVESIIEQDFTDPVDPVDEINEQQDEDNIPQSNMINSDNTVDFVLEAIEVVLSAGAIEGPQLEEENCEAGDKETESQEDNCFEEEFEKTGGPEINEYAEKADIEVENDRLTEENSEQIDLFCIEMSEDKLELEEMQDDPLGLERHCDDELPESVPLTENLEPSVDPQEENFYPPGKNENITIDEKAVVTEDNQWSDSNQSPFGDKISNPQLNEDGGYLNQPLSSDVMACQENSLETEEVHNYDASANIFKSDEEENDTTITNPEISKNIFEWIDQEDVAPQQGENSAETAPCVLGETETFSKLSDHLAEPTENTTNLDDAETIILENNIITPSDNEDHLEGTNEQNVGLGESHDDTDLKEIENSVAVDQDDNALFEEVDQDASNDDEDEIWSKLQKDIELEEQQQNLAAIKIQSSFRGYKTRKELNLASDQKEIAISNDDVLEPTDNDPEGNVSMEGNQFSELESTSEKSLEDNDHDDGLSEALAGVTETIASVALFMTDTLQPNSTLSFSEKNSECETSEIQNNDNDEEIAQALLANVNEVNDVTEESMPNGEEINNIQLIDSYVIVSSISDNPNSPTTQDKSNIEDNQESETNSDFSNFSEKNSSATTIVDNTVNEIVTSDPEVIFELYVESNETTNDGLLESSWQPKEDSPQSLNYSDFEQDGILTIKRNFEEEQENAAATKIQAGYRGYQDRKRLKIVQNQFDENQVMNNREDEHLKDELENAAATKIQAGYRGQQDRKRIKHLKDKITANPGVLESDVQSDEATNLFGSHEIIQQNPPNLTLIELENAAATKIQASYRGHQDRKRTKHFKAKKTHPDAVDIDEHRLFEKENIQNDSDEYLKQTQNLIATELENELENFAATKIQSSYRGHQDRKRVKNLKDQLHNESLLPSSGAINETLQFDETTNLIDSYKDIHNNQVNFTSIEIENAAATKIQAGYRGHRDRKRVKELKDPITDPDTVDIDKTQLVKTTPLNTSADIVLLTQPNVTSIELENAAATKIQAGYRGHQDRKRVQHLKHQIAENQVFDNNENLSDESIHLISDDYVLKPTQPNVASIELENAAATKIQAGYRGHQDRKRVQHLKHQIAENQLFDNNENLSDESIHLISNDYFLKPTQPNVTSIELENAAATKIQAGYRGYQDRKRVQNLKQQIAENQVLSNDENQSDESIQFISDDYVLQPTQPEVTSFEQENAAATKIQASYRGYQDRKRVQNLKHQIEENQVLDNDENQSDEGSISFISDDYVLKPILPELITSFESENAAATKIQASYRGHQDRKRVKHLKANLTYVKNTDEIEFDNTSAEKTMVCECDDLIQNTGSYVTSATELENAAATKIQSGFRGHQDRKRVQHLRENNSASK